MAPSSDPRPFPRVDPLGTSAAGEREIPLSGGRITEGVVRVGDTVRRPVGAHSAFVHRLLRHFEAVTATRRPGCSGCSAPMPSALSISSAGRITTPGTWLHQEIVWLGKHADDIDRGLRDAP